MTAKLIEIDWSKDMGTQFVSIVSLCKAVLNLFQMDNGKTDVICQIKSRLERTRGFVDWLV